MGVGGGPSQLKTGSLKAKAAWACFSTSAARAFRASASAASFSAGFWSVASNEADTAEDKVSAAAVGAGGGDGCHGGFRLALSSSKNFLANAP